MHEELNPLTERIIGAALEVHHELGPGLLENAYEACLAALLSQIREVPARPAVQLPRELPHAGRSKAGSERIS